MIVKDHWWNRWTRRLSRRGTAVVVDQPVAETPPTNDSAVPADSSSKSRLAEMMLADDRYALLLRRQVAETLDVERYAQAHDELERAMALIPAGTMELDTREPAANDATEDRLHPVEALYLDRWPVTNRQFRRFVASGGYDMQPLWDAEVWPAVKGFVDLTGAPGPRFWRSGQYASGEDDHPVVGICWQESAAYARWVGKRLPSEAEWLKAAAWPIALGQGRHRQRRFPWGDTMDHGRCNVWGSGPCRTASVTQFSSGVSAGGVYQLIGNVWEWTSGDFEAVDADGTLLELPTPMKSIRGGAFDTYFDQQATCQFRSGENLLARKHNIGFRCALSVCDVAPPSACERSEKGVAGPDWMRAFKDMGMNMVHLAGFHPEEQRQ